MAPTPRKPSNSPYARQYAQAKRLHKAAMNDLERQQERTSRLANQAYKAVQQAEKPTHDACMARVSSASNAQSIAFELEVQRIAADHVLTLAQGEEPDWMYERRLRRAAPQVTIRPRRNVWRPSCSCGKASTVSSETKPALKVNVPSVRVTQRIPSVADCIDAHAAHVRTVASANLGA